VLFREWSGFPETTDKLALFEEALELNPDDTVTLNSYGTALANHNQADKAFEMFLSFPRL
jgi:Tfp pilus assembly protein PilF